MSTENGSKPRFETVLNSIRKEAGRIREANDKLRELQQQLAMTDHPAPANVLAEVTTTVSVGLAHLNDVFKVSF